MFDNLQSPAPTSGRTRLLLGYVAIAYAISWCIEIPLALAAHGLLDAGIPFWIHYLAAFGPGIAGIIMTWREGGPAAMKELGRRIVRWRVSPVWWVVAVSPLLLFLVLYLVSFLMGRPSDITMLNEFDFLPDIGPAVILIWLATFGFGEEIGWRGFLLPRLQYARSAWSASILLWLIWAAWHVPSFFYLHTVSGPGTLIGFLLGVLAGAIFLTWLYNSSAGSVLIVAVWHGVFDYVTACVQCKTGLIAAVLSTLVMIWAVLIVVLFKRPNLALREKQTYSLP